VEGDSCSDVLVEFAIQYHAAAWKLQEPLVAHDRQRWMRRADGAFERAATNAAFLRLHPSMFLEDSGDLRVKVEEAIRSDRSLGPFLGGMIGDESHLKRFDESTVITTVVSSLNADNGFELDEVMVRHSLQSLRAFLAAKERVGVALVPMPGLSSDSFPVQIASGVELDRFGDEEVNACADSGILRPQFETHPILQPDECVGARIVFAANAIFSGAEEEIPDLARIAQDASSVHHKFGDRSRLRLQETVEDILLVLRLANPTYVTTAGIVLYDTTLFGSSMTWQSRQTRPFIRTSYRLDTSTVEEIVQLWAALQKHATRRKPPSIALRRFNAAVDRSSAEDSIVDHLIALESLVLSDTGSPDVRTELGYRLSLRVAHFLERAGRDRRDTFRFMRKAYELRSRISHGGSIPTEVHLSPEVTTPIHAFLEELTAIIRDTIKIAVEMYGSEPGFGRAEWWDALILGSRG
jgi:hypothetical protein